MNSNTVKMLIAKYNASAALILKGGTVRNRYRFHRVVDESSAPVSAVKAVIGRLVHGL